MFGFGRRLLSGSGCRSIRRVEKLIILAIFASVVHAAEPNIGIEMQVIPAPAPPDFNNAPGSSLTPTATATVVAGATNLLKRISDFSAWPVEPSKIVLGALCISLVGTSLVVEEQDPSPMKLGMVFGLASLWLLLVSLRFRKFTQGIPRERVTAYVTATTSLSLFLIEYFRLKDENHRDVRWLIRLPPFVTFAGWLASHSCRIGEIINDVLAQVPADDDNDEDDNDDDDDGDGDDGDDDDDEGENMDDIDYSDAGSV